MKLSAFRTILLSVAITLPTISFAQNINKLEAYVCVTNIGTGAGAIVVIGNKTTIFHSKTNFARTSPVALNTPITVSGLTAEGTKFTRILPPITGNIAYQIIPGSELVKVTDFDECRAGG